MHCLLEKTSSLTFQFYVSDHTLFREIRIANLSLINAHVAYQFLKKKIFFEKTTSWFSQFCDYFGETNINSRAPIHYTLE